MSEFIKFYQSSTRTTKSSDFTEVYRLTLVFCQRLLFFLLSIFQQQIEQNIQLPPGGCNGRSHWRQFLHFIPWCFSFNNFEWVSLWNYIIPCGVVIFFSFCFFHKWRLLHKIVDIFWTKIKMRDNQEKNFNSIRSHVIFEFGFVCNEVQAKSSMSRRCVCLSTGTVTGNERCHCCFLLTHCVSSVLWNHSGGRTSLHHL